MQFRVTEKKLQNVSLRDLSLHVLDKMFFKVPLCRETPAALQNSWLRAWFKDDYCRHGGLFSKIYYAKWNFKMTSF